MGGVYYLLQDSIGFDNLMHGKSPKKDQKQRSLEDFGKFAVQSPTWKSPPNSPHSCLTPACVYPARKDSIKIASSGYTKRWCLGVYATGEIIGGTAGVRLLLGEMIGGLMWIRRL